MSWIEKENIEELRKEYEKDKLAIQAFYDKMDHKDIPDFAEKLNELYESTLNGLKKEKKNE